MLWAKKGIKIWSIFSGPPTNRTQWFRDGNWAEGSRLPHVGGVESHAVVAVSDTEVLIAGGYDGTADLDLVYLYNVATDTFQARVGTVVLLYTIQLQTDSTCTLYIHDLTSKVFAACHRTKGQLRHQFQCKHLKI